MGLLQGKHVPVSPGKALNLFELLAHELDGKYAGEQILFVGFAETATAIGAQVAVSQAMPYIQTTREIIPGVEYLLFSEAPHTNSGQKDNVTPLFDWGKYYEKAGRIVMPLSVQAHHSFVDGIHIGKFLDLLQEYLDEY